MKKCNFEYAIFVQNRLLKCDFYEKCDFRNAIFVKNVTLKMWILLKTWIWRCFPEMFDFEHVNFWIKFGFLPQCEESVLKLYWNLFHSWLYWYIVLNHLPLNKCVFFIIVWNKIRNDAILFHSVKQNTQNAFHVPLLILDRSVNFYTF